MTENSSISNGIPFTTKVIGLILLLIILFLGNLILGSVHIPLPETLKVLLGQSIEHRSWELIILRTRLPQAIVALSAGMALGVAGLFMQTLFHNPLAGPSVLGISSGASLGVGFVVMVAGQVFGLSFSTIGFWGDFSVVIASMLGALGILMLILFISRKIGGTLPVLIMGVMVGYLSNSIVGILKFYSLEEDVHNYVIWGLGSFSRLSLTSALNFGFVTVGISLLTIFLSKPLNLISLGDRYAKNLGLNIKRARFVIIMTAGILTAVVTSFCGPIIFIGMAVPHMAKMLIKTSNHIKLIIMAGVLGAATALLCSILARMPGLDNALPINSVTAFVGAPVVISVIWKRRKQ
ncbi:FecCD family ABC transporter permease [Labilibacter marinus]|uniref:FecCD family ABC transporter permease n=1 Tax=Labilibacter marinus TaxID=1477105 RepID=UPI000831E6ED|nr:iron ABC transporter permease [Labilibacter marinus]